MNSCSGAWLCFQPGLFALPLCDSSHLNVTMCPAATALLTAIVFVVTNEAASISWPIPDIRRAAFAREDLWFARWNSLESCKTALKK